MPAKKPAAEPKFKVCGNKNKDYFKPGLVRDKETGDDVAVKGELTCSLPQGHPGDHFAAAGADGNEVVNGWWK